MNKWLLVGGAAVLASAVAVAATVFLVGDEPVVGAAAGAPEPPEKLYYPVHPEFIVNYPLQNRPSTVMLEFTLVAVDKNTLNTVDKHSPEMRNDVLALMGDANAEELLSSEGKNKLRDSIKQSINDLLARHQSENEVIDVLFTRFVAQ